MFSSAWLELALVGLATAVTTNALLSSAQDPEKSAAALAAGADRMAVLRATCAASDSGWARLVRYGLREASAEAIGATGDDGAGYRDAPQRAVSPALESMASRERARIARSRAIGVVAAMGSVVGAAMLFRAQPVAMAIVGVLALVTAWRLLVNASRATAALESVRRAMPELIARLPLPADADRDRTSPPVDAAASAGRVAPIPVRTSSKIMGVPFAVLGVLCAAAALAEIAEPVSANEIGTLLGVNVIFATPFLLVAALLLRSAGARIDRAGGELAIVHRLFGVAYARTIAPLELGRRGFVVDVGEGPRPTSYLAIDTGVGARGAEGRIVRIGDGDCVEAAVVALNEAVGRGGERGGERGGGGG